MCKGLRGGRAGHMWGAVVFWGPHCKWGCHVGSEARSGCGGGFLQARAVRSLRFPSGHTPRRDDVPRLPAGTGQQGPLRTGRLIFSAVKKSQCCLLLDQRAFCT